MGNRGAKYAHINTRMSDHFLYVIASNELGPCKLGVSNDPPSRLKQLQTGHPEVLKLFHQEPASAENVKILERLLHRDINHLRKHGEWFNLSTEHAIAHVQFTLIHYDDTPELKEKVRQRKV
jgi:hypothetical protein